MILKCADCGSIFNFPAAIPNGFSHPFGTEIFNEDGCPSCGSLDFEELDVCECCNEQLKTHDAHLCKSCRAELLVKVRSFFGTLTAEEEAQFDDWMDGNSITDRNSWTADE